MSPEAGAGRFWEVPGVVKSRLTLLGAAVTIYSLADSAHLTPLSRPGRSGIESGEWVGPGLG